MGEAGHKTNAAKYPVGTEVEYETYKQGNYPKIKFQYGGGGAGFQGKKGEPKSNSAFAMSYAKDLVVAGSIPLDQLSTYAEKMLTWMNENK